MQRELSAKLTEGLLPQYDLALVFNRINTCRSIPPSRLRRATVRVDTTPSRFASLAPRQVSAQLLRSLASSGLTLSLPASLCSRQGKCLPNFFAPLPPPQAAVARSPLKGSHGCGTNHQICHCEERSKASDVAIFWYLRSLSALP